MYLFEPYESGHPMELANWLQQLVSLAPWKRKRSQSQLKVKEQPNGSCVDALFEDLYAGKELD
jgi:hypothetical protein